MIMAARTAVSTAVRMSGLLRSRGTPVQEVHGGGIGKQRCEQGAAATREGVLPSEGYWSLRSVSRRDRTGTWRCS